MTIKEYRRYYWKHGHPPPRKCKVCGVEIGKMKSYCIDCKTLKTTTICGFDSCKEPRIFQKHYCEYHSVEKRKKIWMEKHLEEIVSCKDCGSDIGKRKNHKHQNICHNCREIRKKNNLTKQYKYYKDRYNNDEEYRGRVREYQSNYNKKRRIQNN